jgi:hypothetical protein
MQRQTQPKQQQQQGLVQQGGQAHQQVAVPLLAVVAELSQPECLLAVQ